MNKSLSVIVTASNEEKNISVAIESVLSALQGLVDDYEIIVVDDGSKDDTRSLAESKAKQNPRIIVVSNETNQGFGYAFRRGLNLAHKTFVTVFPGDNDMSSQVFKDLIGELEDVDIVITYPLKTQKRSWMRKIISRLFVTILNGLFRLKLKYYNGPFLCKLETIRSVNLKSSGLAMVAELLVRLIKSGHTYKEICFEHTGRKNEKSKAFTLKSIVEVTRTVLVLIKDVYFSSSLGAQKVCST